MFVLVPGAAAWAATFSGTVRDGVTAEPLGGAALQLYQHTTPFSGEVVDETESAADGSYSLSAAGGTNLRILASRSGYGSTGVFYGSAPSVVQRDIDLYPAGNGTLEVRVVDADSAEPLPGIQVFIARDSLVATRTTDAAGRVSISLPSERYAVCTSGSDFNTHFDQCYDNLPSPPAQWSTSPKQLLLPGEVVQLDFALRAGAVVTGIVRDRSSGVPLDSRSVAVAFAPVTGGTALLRYANLDDEGRYRISNVPAAHYRVTLSPLGQSAMPFYDSRLYPDIACHGSCPTGEGDIIDIGTASSHQLDFALGPQAGLSGRVVDADSGLPLEQIELVVFTQRNLWQWLPIGSTRSTADGTYMLDYLPRGSIRLATANTRGYGDQRWPGEACLQADCSLGQTVSLAAGATTGGFDFALQRGVAISGSVGSLWTQRNLAAQIDIANDSGSIVWTRSFPPASAFMTAALPPGTYHARAIGAGDAALCQLHEAIDCSVPTSAAAFLAATPIVVGAADVEGVVFALDDALVFRSGFD